MTIKNIIVIRLDEIGDFILTTPFLRELKNAYPDAKIDLIIKPAVYNLAETLPYINKIYLAEPAHRKAWKNISLFIELFKKRLRSYYDIALLPRVAPDGSISRKLAFVSGAKRRITFKQSLSRKDSFLINEIIDSPEPEHSVLKNMRVLDYLGHKTESLGLDLFITEKDKIFAGEILKNSGSDMNRVIALSVASLRSNAHWPIERYIELIRMIHNSHQASFILFGGKDSVRDAENIEKSCGNIPLINLTGKTSLRESAALMKHCKVYLGNDTSVVHIAASFGVPAFVISAHTAENSGFMSTSVRFHPWGVKFRIAQPLESTSPCLSFCVADEPHCILQINVNDVYQRFTLFLKEIGFAESGLCIKNDLSHR